MRKGPKMTDKIFSAFLIDAICLDSSFDFLFIYLLLLNLGFCSEKSIVGHLSIQNVLYNLSENFKKL